MDACLMSKLGKKTKAERPYSSDGGLCDKQEKFKNVLTGSCELSNTGRKLQKQKKEKYAAHLKKPDKKEEIVILICIIKKGLKVLCRYYQCIQEKPCGTPDYDSIYYFIDASKKLDKFKQKFLKIYFKKKNLCDYSKLIKELNLIKDCITREIERNYHAYMCKMELINCIIACFRSVENKIYCLMATFEESTEQIEMDFSEKLISNQSLDNDHLLNNSYVKKSCDENVCTKNKIEKENSKSTNQSNTTTVIDSKKSKRVLCEDIQNKSDNKKNEIFDMTLEYYRYNLNDSDSSSNEDSIESFEQELPRGYVKSKIYKKDNKINLTVKFITNGEQSAIMDLKKEAESSEKSNKLIDIANNMAKFLCMSKQWYESGKEVYQQVLNKC